tara:strand:+ start:750 stop:1034 length:285 start_codon:yes stop_codon:yes gene_type:complete
MQTSLIKISNNFHAVEFADTTSTNKSVNRFWYSYQTCIAFEIKGNVFICENAWSTTTGKHLNHINPDKKIRMNKPDFEKSLLKFGIVQTGWIHG